MTQLQNKDRHNFVRGDVFWVEFERETVPPNSYVLHNRHLAIMLEDSTVPNLHVMVVPISSMPQQKSIKPTELPLLAKNYTGNNAIIRHDSYVKTHQVTTISRNRIKGYKGQLTSEDLISLDMLLIITLGLRDRVTSIIREALEKGRATGE
jgi:mRNA-degrading endonuclease toxin of MazEF toxin-antitoxin module